MIRASFAAVAAGLLLLSSFASVSASASASAAEVRPAPGEVQLVSAGAASSSTLADHPAESASVSADGRFVAFDSAATNLTAIPSTSWQVYVRDTQTGTTQMVSSIGGAAGAGDSTSPSISADGSRIVYLSNATNLNTGDVRQAMIWSRETGTSRVVSISNGEPPSRASVEVTQAVISQNGSTVAFVTRAKGLTANETFGVNQVFARDLVSGLTRLVSVDQTAVDGRGSAIGAMSPSVSADGSTIAFLSASSLAPQFPDVHGKTQVYVATTHRHDLIVASVGLRDAPAGEEVASLSLSPDGSTVAFSSSASDLVAEPTGGHRQIFLRELIAGRTRLASYNISGTAGANNDCDTPTLSSSGKSLAFVSSASDLGAGETTTTVQVISRDLITGRTLVASSTGGAVGDNPSVQPSLSSDGRFVAFESKASNLVPGTRSTTQQVYVRNLQGAPQVERVDGADRFAVAAAVSKNTFAPHVDVVYVASGTVFPDALSGSAAAGAEHAPVLLVTKDAIPSVAAAELTRLQPARIVVLGGPNTISPAVETALAAYSPTVKRIGGADRFEVSAAVSAAVFRPTGNPPAPIVFVASGAVFPDALTGSAAAGLWRAPVLLVGKDSVPASVLAELTRLAPAKIYLLGGTTSIEEPVLAALKGIAPNTFRVGGADRFEVASEVARRNFAAPTKVVYVASGAVFPDALAGSAAAIAEESPVLLVTASTVPDAIARQLVRFQPQRIVVLGGRNTISDAVQTELGKYLATG